MASLLDRAQNMAARILSGGFGVPVRVVSPAGQAVTVVGLVSDVGVTLDPSTGMSILGRRVSVSLPVAPLLAANLGFPEPRQQGLGDFGEPEEWNPWRIGYQLPGSVETTAAVDGVARDATLGVVVLQCTVIASSEVAQ